MRMHPWALATALLSAACENNPPVSAGGSGGAAGAGAGTGGTAQAALAVSDVAPTVLDPAGGSLVIVRGSGFTAGTAVQIGGAAASVEVTSDSELHVVSPALAVGRATLQVQRADEEIAWDGTLTVWSPAEIPGARVFDAAHGVTAAESDVHHEWQRLTPVLHEAWRVRDGNTLTWLPSTGRFWMVGGWNGNQAPDGFSTIDPNAYPPENTTSEVWSSADGVQWTLELPHGNTQFERRHAHNTVLWKDRLWMIGGDHHQGKYNHDVVSSADGKSWKVELGPGTTPPPWSERALQVSGVHAGKLWTVGGQDLIGDPDTQVHHNDVWNTEDGVHWQQVAADAPASETRWAGCGVLDGLIEFHGEMWLVGCARYRDDAVGPEMSNEVWSTTDGVTWKQHAIPPWKGKIWHNVVVWQDQIWVLFGFTYGDPANGWPVGNSAEVWYSSDGETWKSLPHDIPAPGSHAQGIAVRDDDLLYAGGNYGFGFGAGLDRSVWRLSPVRGAAVVDWADRTGIGLHTAPPEPAAAPLLVKDAFGPGRPGLHFDGSTSVLALAGDAVDEAGGGFSVFWAARAPYSPPPWGWVESYNPASTIVGGAALSWQPVSSVGFTDGALSYVNRVGAPDVDPQWDVVHVGAGLQEDGDAAVHDVGISHATDGKLRAFVDGVAADAGETAYDSPRGWSRIGGGIDGGTEGAFNRFAGTIGAVVIVPGTVGDSDAALLHQWALGRFGAP